MIEQKIQENIGIENLETPGYQHHDALWFDKKEHNSYINLATKIEQLYPFKYILEIGSGAGSLSNHLRSLNVNAVIVTLDGNKDTLNSPYILKENHFIVRTDNEYQLEENNKLIQFDLVLCYEHLEHIEKSNLDIWFKMLHKHSHSGTIFLGSASTLDYNPRVHVTLEDKDWWVDKFKKYGWYNLNVNLLNTDTKPFNFELQWTNELNFYKI